MDTGPVAEEKLSAGTLWLLAPQGQDEDTDRFRRRMDTVRELMHMGYEHGFDTGYADGWTDGREASRKVTANTGLQPGP